MRKGNKAGSLLLGYLVNIVFTFHWSIPAWILLALHFILGISIWWFVAALAAWLVGIILFMTVIGWASKCTVPVPERENKNSLTKL